MEFSKILDELDSKSNFKITGLCFQYLYICERELWFYMHGVDQDQDNIFLSEGRLLDDRSYGGSEEIFIDNTICIDISEDGKIIEVKNSSKKSKASYYQLLYYMWFLDHYFNLEVVGFLKYPKENKSEKVCLSDRLRCEVERDIERIYEIYKMSSPPEYEQKEVCSSCAYQDFCKIGGIDE